MLKTTVKINNTEPRFSDFYYSFRFIDPVFLEYHWFILNNSFYWPEGFLPDFFKDKHEKPISTNNARLIDFSNDGMFGVFSPEFMYSFYKNIRGDWQYIIAIKKEDLKNITKDYIDHLLAKKIEDIDINRHPVVFANVDGVFWILRSKDEELEKKLLVQYPKSDGLKHENIQNEYW